MEKDQRLKQVIDFLINSPSKQLSYELFLFLFTSQELEQLTARFEIVQSLVQAKKTQREIAAELGLSIAKITRGSNELKRISKDLKAYLGDYFS